MDTVLDLQDLVVTYGAGAHRQRAVDRLTLSIRRGDIFGFLGPNGAGKTSTIKAILGIVVPASGSVTVFRKGLSRELKRSVGYMPEVANYYWYLTPRELLMFYGRLSGVERGTLNRKVDELLSLVGLDTAGNALIKTLSKGMLQKVSFAQSLVNDPDLLILDEPTSGLDPVSRMNMRDTLLKLKAAGKTIFFSSHELSEVETISDRVAILANGRLLKEASIGDLLNEKGERVSLEQYFFSLVKDGR